MGAIMECRDFSFFIGQAGEIRPPHAVGLGLFRASRQKSYPPHQIAAINEYFFTSVIVLFVSILLGYAYADVVDVEIIISEIERPSTSVIGNFPR